MLLLLSIWTWVWYVDFDKANNWSTESLLRALVWNGLNLGFWDTFALWTLLSQRCHLSLALRVDHIHQRHSWFQMLIHVILWIRQRIRSVTIRVKLGFEANHFVIIHLFVVFMIPLLVLVTRGIRINPTCRRLCLAQLRVISDRLMRPPDWIRIKRPVGRACWCDCFVSDYCDGVWDVTCGFDGAEDGLAGGFERLPL